MSQRFRTLGISAGLACTVVGAAAQSTSVTVYGVVDEYMNYMTSSSGTKLRGLEDGAFLRSRLGFKGREDLGDGYATTFLLEGGQADISGTPADSTRFFDRQSYVGLASPIAELRLGRQNGPAFWRGCEIDFTCRTLGSMVNNFGVPSRYDNTISVTTVRNHGVLAEVDASMPELASGNHAMVYQLGLDWKSDAFTVGYAGMRGRPVANAAVNKDVVYDNLFANWNYGKGKVYLTYVRSNNNTSNAISNNAGSLLSNVGGYNAGTNADLNNFYNIPQVSADYQVSPFLRVGALWGKINDESGRGRGASGGAIGAYYDVSKRTMLLAEVDTIRNGTNGGWRPAGSSGLQYNFTNPNDINGRTINGYQVGIVHRF